MRKLLPVSAIVLAFLLVGLLLYYFFLTPKGCRTEIISGQSGLTVKITDRKKWNSFISALTVCTNGQFPVYDRKSDRPYSVQSVSYIFTDNPDGLTTFSNQAGRVFYRWKIEVNQEQNSAQVFIHLPDTETDDFGLRLFSSVFATLRRLFAGPLYNQRNA
jgi:hypothetical protein